MSIEPIDADELRALRRVADCAREARDRQRAYYATRFGVALFAAKNAEADLDRALADDSKNDAPDGHVWTMPPAGEIARTLPRQWCNTVKVYDALWSEFKNFRFKTDDLFGETARDAIRKATDGRIKPQTVARMMTALRRAGVAVREGRNEWGLFPPTDERREAVEREAGKLNAHAAKEPAHA